MAGVLGNTNLFSYCNQNQQNKDISVFPKRCSGSFSLPSAKLKSESLRLSASLDSDFCGRRVVLQENKGLPKRGISSKSSIKAQALQTGLIGKVQKWWEKGLQSNMKEVASAQDLVDSLLNAGDKLVIVDFFSPGCGGCKALHPKICQLAEMHPDVQFLHVNYEEQKSMCYSLNVHVLPFFRFYRGAHGRLCSFSCTNATIKKFKDALAKHTTDRCSLGPAKGLEEKELLALAANKELNFNYTPKPQPLPVPAQEEVAVAEAAPSHSNPNHPLPLHSSSPLKSANKELNFNFTPKPQPVPASAQEEVVVAEAATSHSNSNLPLPRRSTALKSAQDTKEKKTLVTAGTPQVRFGCLGRFFCLEERRPGSVQVKVDSSSTLAGR